MAVSSEARIATNINAINSYKALNNMRISLLYSSDTISRMGDVNLTEEQINTVKLQILQNIAIAQLAQSNVIQQQYLQIFRQGINLIESVNNKKTKVSKILADYTNIARML